MRSSCSETATSAVPLRLLRQMGLERVGVPLPDRIQARAALGARRSRTKLKAAHIRVGERLGRDETVDLGELLTEEVEMEQAALDGEPLIGRKILDSQPGATLTAEEVAHRRASLQATLQHRRDLVLDLRAALGQALLTQDQQAQRPLPLIAGPDPGD